MSNNKETLKSASAGSAGNTNTNKKSSNQTQSLEYKVKHMEIGNVNSNTANNKSPDKTKTFLNNSNKNNIDNLLNEASSDESLANNNNINRLDSYDHPPSKKLLTSPQEDVKYSNNIDLNSNAQVQPMNIDTEMNANANDDGSLISDVKVDNDDSMNASSNPNENAEDGNCFVEIFGKFEFIQFLEKIFLIKQKIIFVE